MTRKFLLAATLLVPASGLYSGASAQPVTGLYVGGGGGANFLQQEHGRSASYLNGTSAPFPASVSHDAGYVGVASVGWGFGNGLRAELEGDYRYNRISKSGGAGLVSEGGKEQKYGGMVNVLFDLDVGSPYVFPYFGGGAGYQWVDRQRSISGTISVPTPFGTFGGPSVTNTGRGVDGSFAYQVIGGLSFPVPPVVGLSLTAEYRYFALAGDRSYGETFTGLAGLSGRRIKVTDNYNHSLMLGLRYAFNVAPPAVAAPVPAPAVSSDARTYLVFFDWDRADLTDRARAIIAQAAQATTRTQVTRIEVSGHTDTSGTARYNQGLSERRAQAVKTELVRLGVPAASVTTQGFGFSKPLVATGPGVREPQNRRVEIVLR